MVYALSLSAREMHITIKTTHQLKSSFLRGQQPSKITNKISKSSFSAQDFKISIEISQDFMQILLQFSHFVEKDFLHVYYIVMH